MPRACWALLLGGCALGEGLRAPCILGVRGVQRAPLVHMSLPHTPARPAELQVGFPICTHSQEACCSKQRHTCVLMSWRCGCDAMRSHRPISPRRCSYPPLSVLASPCSRRRSLRSARHRFPQLRRRRPPQLRRGRRRRSRQLSLQVSSGASPRLWPLTRKSCSSRESAARCLRSRYVSSASAFGTLRLSQEEEEPPRMDLAALVHAFLVLLRRRRPGATSSG